MRFEYGALPWEMLGRRPVMITLTYPGDWDVWVGDARELHKHREALRSRWTRKFGTPIGVWVTEFQKRGAPHLHMYMALPKEVSEKEYLGAPEADDGTSAGGASDGPLRRSRSDGSTPR